MRKIFKKLMALSILISFLVIPQLGFAEDYTTKERLKKEKTEEEAKKAEKEKAVKMEEMVVTATRTERKIIEVPTNITVIDKEDIHRMKPRDISDILEKIPGIIFKKYSGASPNPNIRGTQTAYTGGAYIMLNGIPIQLGVYGTTELEQIAPGDIEKIEVVKGPVSSVYGGDAAKGVINIITKKGRGKPSYTIGGRYGSYGDMRGIFATRGATEKFDYSLSVNRREYDGYRRGAENKGTNFLGDVGYFWDDYTRIGLLINVNDFDRKNASSLNKEEREKDKRKSPFLSTKDITDVIIGLSFDRDMENRQLKASVYYKNRDEYFFYPYPNKWGGNPDKYKWKRDTDQNIWGFRTQFGLKNPLFGKKNMLIVGFDMERDELDTRQHYLVQSASNIEKERKGSGDFKKNTYGIFMQDEFELSDSLSITAGLRWDIIKVDLDYLNDDLDYDKEDGKLNPRIGIAYRFTEKNSAYISYSNAYQPPTLCQLYHVGQFHRKLDPVDYTNYEIGYRHELGKYLSLDLTSFYMIIKDEIRCYYEEGKWAGPNNYGKTIHKGLEILARGEFANKLKYQLSYAYLKTEVKEGKVKNFDLSGKELDDCPHHTFSGILDYQFLKIGNMEIDLHFDISAYSNYYLDAKNTEKYPSYEVANTRITFYYQNFICCFGINNLFDEDYDESATLSASGKYYYSPAPGRTYMGGLSFRF